MGRFQLLLKRSRLVPSIKALIIQNSQMMLCLIIYLDFQTPTSRSLFYHQGINRIFETCIGVFYKNRSLLLLF